MSMSYVKSFFENRNISIQASFLKRVLNSREIESSSSIDSKPPHKSNFESSCADDQTHILDLPIDSILEILLRLPRVEITSCSLTCKYLLSLTTSPFFYVSYYSLHRHSTHNFLVYQKLHEPPKFMSTSPCVGSSTIKHLEKSKHFKAGLSVLGSSIGLLLIGNANRINRKQLVVFNPATKESLSIPLPSDCFTHKWGVGFIGGSNPRSFEIILVGGGQVVYSFSSKNKQWTTMIASADDNHIDYELYNSNNTTRFSCKSALHASGILCWEYGKSYLRVYNIERSHFSTIQFPFGEDAASYCLSESMDHIKYISTTETDCVLRVWVLEKACLSWKLEYTMLLSFHLVPIGFVVSEQEVVLSRRKNIFTYSLLVKKLKCCIQDHGPLRGLNMGQFFPYKMNIDDFPSIPN